MWYGQLVVGPPGSGKSTYCSGMQQLLNALKRRHIVVNLDPMNDLLPYECAIDVMKLTDGAQVMRDHNLGPNGALLFCMEYLLENLDWLLSELKKHNDCYVIIDCPGQVELFTHHYALREIIEKLQRQDFRMTSVQIVDSTLCTDEFKYISALLLSLNTQLQLELPHVNVLSKGGILFHKPFAPLEGKCRGFRFEYYAEARDLGMLLRAIDNTRHPFSERLRAFSETVCELVEDFGFLGFLPLSVHDKECMINALRVIDRANGFSLGGLEFDSREFAFSLEQAPDMQDMLDTIHERYVVGSGGESGVKDAPN